jgi:glycosyltransferase involved in cell wall biosynthesis
MEQAYPSISVVVPVYNSEGSLPELVERLERVFQVNQIEAEVILVNDGSRDQSWAQIQHLAERSTVLRGINLMRNYGQHNALLCGIRAACNEVVVTIDDDLQNPPEEIPELLRRLTPDYDVIYGTPRAERHGLWRDMASRLTKLALQSAMGAETARNVSAFRAVRTKLRDAFADYRGSFVSVDVLLTWATTRFAAVAVRHDERQHGTSNYTFRKLLTHAMNMVTGFSVIPLQVASFLGFALTIFGIAILGYVLVRYFTVGGGVPGFPFLASLISIVSGAQMFALGIIGEYLARMHFRSLEKPTYAVRQTVESGAEHLSSTSTQV